MNNLPITYVLIGTRYSRGLEIEGKLKGKRIKLKGKKDKIERQKIAE